MTVGGLPIKIATNGRGMAITIAANGRGIPVKQATNGFGIPVVQVAKGGIPVVMVGSTDPNVLAPLAWQQGANTTMTDLGTGRMRSLAITTTPSFGYIWKGPFTLTGGQLYKTQGNIYDTQPNGLPWYSIVSSSSDPNNGGAYIQSINNFGNGTINNTFTPSVTGSYWYYFINTCNGNGQWYDIDKTWSITPGP